MKEDSINIAGVSCRISKVAKLTYETIYNSAIGTDYLKGEKNRLDLIDKEIRDNGFKPTKTNGNEVKANQSIEDREPTRKRTSRKRKKNS